MQQDGLTGPAWDSRLLRGFAWRDRADWVEGRVSLPGDNEETRRNKVLFTFSCLLVIPVGLLWGGLYLAYDEPVAAVLALSYPVITIANTVVLFRFRRFAVYWWTERAIAFALPIALQLALGGFVGSSAVVLWPFLAVLFTVTFGGPREAWWVFGAFAATVTLAVVVQPRLQVTNHLPAWLVMAFFALNIVAVCAVVFVILQSFTRDRRRLRELEVSYLNQEVMLRQADKLATLGTLAAGVAHELNNPAAAAARGVAQLRPLIEEMQGAYLKMCGVSSPHLAAAIKRAGELIGQRAGQVVSLSPLERGDRVAEMGRWLRGLGVEQPVDAARALVDLGYGRAQVEELTSTLPRTDVPAFVSWMARADESQRLLAEVSQGAGRISQIVGAMRSYTYLGQAPVQDVDITDGLENTLVLLGSKLKGGVVVHREYAEQLPRVQAHGGELNQVWTNIIDNAIDALGGHGNITVRTAAQDGYVVVEIEDDGPGMPPQTAARVFDPFFTTKPPGKGTGLGLSISHNIVVQEHKGRIGVDSKPGRTTFRVLLPMAAPADRALKPQPGSGGRTSPRPSPPPPPRRPA